MITRDVRTHSNENRNSLTQQHVMATIGVDQGLVALATISFLSTHCLVSPTVRWSRYCCAHRLRVYNPNSVTWLAPRASDIWAVIGSVTPLTIPPSILDVPSSPCLPTPLRS